MTTNESSESLMLSIKREFNAPIEAVFLAWTNADKVSQWFAPSSDFSVKVPLMDAQLSGNYRIEMTNPDGETFIAIGEYLEVSAPDKLVFTWSWEGGDGGMRVTLDFTSHNGKTGLVLTHEQFPDTDSRDHHNEGWIGCLDRLGEFLD